MVAIGEVVVQRADGDAGQRGDLAHVRCVQTLVGEHLFGGRQDRLHRRLPDALSERGLSLYCWFHKMNRRSVPERYLQAGAESTQNT